MKTLRLLFLVTALWAGFIYNASAQSTYVTLVAATGQQVSYTVPADTLAKVVHVTPPMGVAPGSDNSFDLADFYSVQTTIKGMPTYYYPILLSGVILGGNWPDIIVVVGVNPTINNNWPVVGGPATITLNVSTNYLWTVLCTIELTKVKTEVSVGVWTVTK